MEVLSETRQTFRDGLTLYESRSDKAYSLTDCIAMNVMSKCGITDVLTHDETSDGRLWTICEEPL